MHPKAAVALLEYEDRRGTGYLIQPDCILTCYHVIQPAFPDGWVRVRFPHGEYAGRVSLVDVANDCAVLRLDRPVVVAPPLRLGLAAVRRGQRWESYGFPAATFESGLLISGEVQDSEGENLRGQPSLVLHSRNVTAGALMQGFSGSPVLVEGVVIGQLQQIVPDEQSGAQFGVLFATPARVLAPLLPTVAADAASPYRGLAAFQQEDAGLFFGREALTQRLWQSYRAAYRDRQGTRLLTILGPSGAGKSSVARAGLLPALLQQPVPGPQPLRIAVLKPGEHPVDMLTRALLLHDGSARPAAPVPDLSAHRQLRQALRQPDEHGRFDGLRLFADALPQIAERPLMVLVDQFEELYTLCKSGPERDAFVSLLLDAASDANRHVSVVLTLRSDYLGEIQRYHHKLSQVIAERLCLLPAMGDEELRCAISEPATRAGHAIDASTVELLLSQARGSAGTLPLLEFALTCIWEGLSQGKAAALTLKEIGGVGGALAARAQELFAGLDPAAQRIARRAFLRLGQFNDSARDIRKRRLIKELCGAGETEEQVLAVLRHFACDQARLISLSAEPETGTAMAEVTHEALFEHWALCRAWIDEHRGEHRFHNRLTEAAQLWVQASRPEGRLWRPPDLDLLRDFHSRRADDLTQDELEFLRDSEQQHAAERAAKEEAKQQFVQMYEQMRQQVLATYVEQGRQALHSHQVHHAALWLHRAYQEGSRHPMLPYLLAQAMHPLDAVTTVLARHPDRILGLAFHPDGTQLVTACRDGLVRQWECSSGQLLRELKHASAVRSAIYSPDGATILTDTAEFQVRIWSTLSGQLQTLLGHGGRIQMALFSPDGKYVVIASEDHTARVWAARDGQPIRELRGHTDILQSASFSPDGSRIITASYDQTVRIWELGPGRPALLPLAHPSAVIKARFSPDGGLIATACKDQLARIFSAKTGKLLAVLQGHSGQLTNLRWSLDGERLLTTSHDHTARLWQARTGQLVAELSGHSGSVVAAAFSPDGRYIVTGSWDHTARIWWANTGAHLFALHGHLRAIIAVAFSPDATHVGTASDDQTVRLWSLQKASPVLQRWQHGAPIAAATFSPDGRQVVTAGKHGAAQVFDRRSGHRTAQLEGHSAALTDVACSPDGTAVATASLDHVVVLWEGQRGRRVAELRGHGHWVNAVRYSPKGSIIATASNDRTARLWEAPGGRCLATLSGHTGRINRVEFSPDGSRLATASYDATVRLWAVPTGQPIATLSGHEQVVNDLSYNATGDRLATASDDGTACIWDAVSGTVVHVLRGHEGGVNGIRFSPSGELVATASRDDSARVWDARSGKLLAEMIGHSGYVSSIAFSPDSSRVVTASRDGTARLWEARTGKSLAVLRGHRDLVKQASFSPDGTAVLTTSSDHQVLLWPCPAETRSATQLAAVMRCRVAYAWQDEIIVPAPPEIAPCQVLPAAGLAGLQAEDGIRWRSLATAAWTSGDGAATHAHLAEACRHFLALPDPASASVVLWAQAAVAEAQSDAAVANTLYAEAEALIEKAHAEPAARAAVFIECARVTNDHFWLPRAAVRALDAALKHTADRSRVLVYRLESMVGTGQLVAAVAEAESLLLSNRLHVGWRSLASCLAWVAARLLDDSQKERIWAQRAVAEFKSSLSVGDLGWSFTSLRRALERLTPLPRSDAALELVDTLEGGWNAETASRLGALLPPGG